jgi:hypothetical protein
MIFGLKAKAAVAAVVVVGAAGAGWTAKGWFEDSKDLAAMEAQQALVEEIRAGQREVSQHVEQRLSELRANERIIDRGIIREIEKPVYRNVCVPPGSDAFRLLRDLAAGQAPGKPDDQVPEGSANAD